VNKLLYRSKQRGFLELDLLVGLWAEQHIPQMDTRMLQQFSVVLEQVRHAELRMKWIASAAALPVLDRKAAVVCHATKLDCMVQYTQGTMHAVVRWACYAQLQSTCVWLQMCCY
jgi:succinate dehydrogenase flavin-adding protein (antitoxin of CptAB toxin-antitoxin module)